MQHHFLHFFLGMLYRRRDEKPLSCARERNIQQAHLLGKLLAAQPLLYRAARKAWIFKSARGVVNFRTESKLGVDEHRLPEVGIVKPARGIAHENDRELKPLGLVDGHYLHSVPGRYRTHVSAALGKLPDPAAEAVQAAKSSGVESLCKSDHHAHVRAPLRRILHGGAKRHKVKLIIDKHQKLVDRHFGSARAQFIEHLKKMRALFAVLCGLFQRREEVRFSVGKADFGKLVGGKAECAGAQHRDERNILMRIVDNRKQAHERGYLRRAEEAASLPCRNGYAAQDKLAAIGFAHRVCRAHEQRYIAVAERAAVYRHSRAHKLDYFFRNRGGLLFGLAAQVVLVGAHVDEDKLRSHALIVVNAAAFKLRVFVVIDLAELFGHACRENAVYTVDDLAARAEVFLKHDLHRLALTRIGQKCVFFVFIGEYQRVGKAETVD